MYPMKKKCIQKKASKLLCYGRPLKFIMQQYPSNVTSQWALQRWINVMFGWIFVMTSLLVSWDYVEMMLKLVMFLWFATLGGSIKWACFRWCRLTHQKSFQIQPICWRWIYVRYDVTRRWSNVDPTVSCQLGCTSILVNYADQRSKIFTLHLLLLQGTGQQAVGHWCLMDQYWSAWMQELSGWGYAQNTYLYIVFIKSHIWHHKLYFKHFDCLMHCVIVQRQKYIPLTGVRLKRTDGTSRKRRRRRSNNCKNKTQTIRQMPTKSVGYTSPRGLSIDSPRRARL